MTGPLPPSLESNKLLSKSFVAEETKRKKLHTYAAPFRKRKNMKSSYVWLKLEATMHRAFMNEMAIRTFRRPTASATDPQAYAPAIIPMKMIELSHPFAWVLSFRSHCALGRMKDMEITSISSLVLTKPHTASRK